jgi:wee1-like protein kinase
LKDSSISRYKAEFKEISLIGSGEHGAVFKCRNRLDGCIYALKRSKQPLTASVDEQFASREVYAHAVLESHPHIVRYYSAWAEDNHMLIQSEFCNGGSLSSAIANKISRGQVYNENDLTQMLLQVSQGLKYIHSKRLVHLDIKPGNIFISCPGLGDKIDCDCCYSKQFNQVIYKIGDMGHVTSIDNPDAEDGDCRFMARELLEEDYMYLEKADIFALALTAYMMGSGEELPRNGPKWHEIRDGNLPELTNCSGPFNQLLKSMVHKDASARPSASALTQHPVLCPFATKSKDELHKELSEEKLKNESLAQELKVARDAAMSGFCSRLAVGGNSKWKANRSLSVSSW